MPSVTSETLDPNGILVSDLPVVTRPVTVASGQNLAVFSLVGKVSASGKVVLSLAASSDGSETPYGVLLEAVDASGADAAGRVYRLGGLDESLIQYGTGHTADTVRDALDAQGLHLFKRQALG